MITSEEIAALRKALVKDADAAERPSEPADPLNPSREESDRYNRWWDRSLYFADAVRPVLTRLLDEYDRLAQQQAMQVRAAPQITGEQIRAALREYGEGDNGLLIADGLDAAIVGVASRCGQPDLVVYSIPKAIDCLVVQGMTHDAAIEYLEFNSIGAWVGEKTPAWLDPIEVLVEFVNGEEPVGQKDGKAEDG